MSASTLSASSANAAANAGLFIFTRFPQPGRTKTRLIAAVGAAGAANIQRQMTEHLLNRFQSLHLRRLALQVHFTGGTAQQMLDWLGDRFLRPSALVPQCEGDLGERLSFALSQGFAAGLQQIVIVGSDCPDIDEEKIVQSLGLLASHDVVLGPAVDGGYYLIGLNRPCPCLFEHIPWSSAQVLESTRVIAARNNLSVALLSPLSDVDRPEDLPLWYALQNS